jgi:hypothetical protein
MTQAQSAANGVNDSKLKILGVGEEENSEDVILNISKEAQLKLQNQENSAAPRKKAGVTSARELFEEENALTKYMAGRDEWRKNIFEAVRLDEPETYAKYEELSHKSWELGDTEEGQEYFRQADTVLVDWYFRRCFKTPYVADGNPFNPVAGKYLALSSLENLYSDADHDTSFNFYSSEYSGRESSLWRYNSKFNVLLTVDMLDTLEIKKFNESESEQKEERDKLLRKIDKSVKEMKAVELSYEGNLEYLRFGVKLQDDGSITYHANYKGCEDKDGIMANSAEELLKALLP